MQFEFFGSQNSEIGHGLGSQPKSKTKVKRARGSVRKSRKKAHGAMVEEKPLITMRHSNASKSMPDYMLLLCPEYDPSTDELLLDWDESTLLELWDGMLNEHLKQLRQTKPGSATREEILKWQETIHFKELCSAISYRPEDIRDGVLTALSNYDSYAQARSVINMLIALDVNVINEVEKAGLTRRECNSRRFKDQLADQFLSEFRKCVKNQKKWENLSNLMCSDELSNLASKIGLDISGVINRVKPKLYFLQHPDVAEFEI